MAKVGAPSPWRYACLVAGEYAPGRGSDSSHRRLRLLECPAAPLGAFCEAVRLLGGQAVVTRLADSPRGPGKIADGECAAAVHQFRAAAERVKNANRDLAASVNHALDGFARGRPPVWRCGEYGLEVGRRVLVMGIVNLTPDSFSDGGALEAPGAAERTVWQMVEDGADIVDVGGESTRPHAERVTAEEELRRIRPLLQHIAGRLPIPISVDTSKADVARAALDLGASIVNDVTAMTGDPQMLTTAAASGAGVILMHMKGTPATMQEDPRYDDLVREIYLFLHRRARACVEAGIAPERIAIDPGIGFGKTGAHNLELLRRLGEFTSAGLPVVVGPSRKGFIGRILDLPPGERVEGTIAACTAAVLHGASVIRVHDVRPAVRGVRVACAIADSPAPLE